jgi:hypothetical protein
MLLSNWYRRFSILAVIHLVNNWKEILLKRAETWKIRITIFAYGVINTHL